MGYAFSQPIGSTPSLADAANAPQTPGSEILMSSTAAIPGAYYITKDTSAFEALIFSFVYNGNPVVPAIGDYMQCQVIWYSSNFAFGAANILWVDTFEIPSRFLPNFINSNRSIVHLPVRGKVAVISFNTPVAGGVNPTMDWNVLGSTSPLARSIFTSDQAFFGVTDNILLDVTGGALASGATGPWFFGGLQSGPVTMSLFFTLAAATVTGVILQTGFGSSLVGLPELTMTTPALTGNYRTFITGVYTARRPIRARLLNNGGSNISGYAINVVRDEP